LNLFQKFLRVDGGGAADAGIILAARNGRFGGEIAIGKTALTGGAECFGEALFLLNIAVYKG